METSPKEVSVEDTLHGGDGVETTRTSLRVRVRLGGLGRTK